MGKGALVTLVCGKWVKIEESKRVSIANASGLEMRVSSEHSASKFVSPPHSPHPVLVKTTSPPP